MTINEYQKAALRTANPRLTLTMQLENGLMGLCGEAGEAMDILKKFLLVARYPEGFDAGLSQHRKEGDI